MQSTASTLWPSRLWSRGKGAKLALCTLILSCQAAPQAGLPTAAPTALNRARVDVAYDVSLLEDPVVGPEQRERALLRTQAAGLLAFEPCITRLASPQDAWAFDRSPFASPLVPDPAAAGPTTVKQELEGLLYRLLDGGPPPASDPRALGATDGPYVGDWAAWWAEHRGQTLGELRAWAASARARRHPNPVAAEAMGRAAGPAPHGALGPRAEADSEHIAAFSRLRARLESGKATCAALEEIGEGRPALDRHVKQACAQLGRD